jgi:hypothetical protein
MSNITDNIMLEFCLWDIAPCSPMKINRRFGGTCRLHRQGRRISQSVNHRALLATWFLTWHILRPWKWRGHVSLKRRLTLTDYRAFVTTAMRTSNCTWCYFCSKRNQNVVMVVIDEVDWKFVHRGYFVPCYLQSSIYFCFCKERKRKRKRRKERSIKTQN